jgi:hypothetical protein
MKKPIKVCIAVVGLILILSMSEASEYEFGTKVGPYDSDIGKHLFAMPPSNIVQKGTTVYLNVPPIFLVSKDDIRLTPFGDLPAGSKVEIGDPDTGPGVTVPFAGIFYVEQGPAGYDLEDPVYIHAPGPVIAINDVRLIAIDGLRAGTRVLNFEPDNLKPVPLPQRLVANPPSFFNPAMYRYFDVNGNKIYDAPDDVYLDISWPALFFPFDGHVVVNDVRLSGPVS